MDRDEFIKELKKPKPSRAHEFLNSAYENKDKRPDWLQLFEGDEKSQFLAHGVEAHVIFDWDEQEPDVDASSDPVFEAPVETVYTIHMAEHRTTGYTRILYQPSKVFTVSYGPHVAKYRALEKEFRMLGDNLESQRQPVQLHCRLVDGRLQVYYMWTPSEPHAEPSWCILADEVYTPQKACDWKLRSQTYAAELAKDDEAAFPVLLERARHHVLYEAAVCLNLEIAPRCEILPIPADVVGKQYGFALCNEMLDPFYVVTQVKPSLQARYDDIIIQTFLEDVGIDLKAVEALEENLEGFSKPQKQWTPNGDTLPEECDQCGNFLIRNPGIMILEHKIPARCPRCWAEQSVTITDEIRNAFSQYIVQPDTDSSAGSSGADGDSD